MSTLEHLVGKARHAAAIDGPGPLSKGEALAAALILNRPDWLADMGYTIAEAIDRLEEDWVRLIPQAARIISASDAVTRRASISSQEQAQLSTLAPTGVAVDVNAKLYSYGGSPGYRRLTLTFDVSRVSPEKEPEHRLCLNIRPEDGENIVRHILEAHRLAWQGTPLDSQPDQKRPRWIDNP
ncbi:hypothetical protein [Herbaspirillum sp. RV1423]|uniref:hypothetical protein n=1 Tax=Herbaspirillum sp. RV1423 TaxID=1443993 RepID=UPI0018CC6FDC|nr:hypothetical protein [Herbaspirillum sp. RV1423]